MALAGQVTNPERLEGRDVTFQSDGTAMNAYLVRPREPGSYPGIIVIHEAWGVVEHIRDVARRFASLGYIALAPDLYTRVGAPKPDDAMSIVLSRMLALSDEQLVRDVDQAVTRLEAEPGMAGRIGCVGFCMGGRTTLLYACSSQRLSAAIDCWGGGITADAAPVTPQRPTPIVDLIPRLSCPLYVVAERRTPTPRPRKSRSCASAWSSMARPSSSTCSRVQATHFSPTTGRATARRRHSSCGRRWCRSSTLSQSQQVDLLKAKN